MAFEVSRHRLQIRRKRGSHDLPGLRHRVSICPDFSMISLSLTLPTHPFEIKLISPAGVIDTRYFIVMIFIVHPCLHPRCKVVWPFKEYFETVNCWNNFSVHWFKGLREIWPCDVISGQNDHSLLGIGSCWNPLKSTLETSKGRICSPDPCLIQNVNNATKKFDYRAVADRLRTVSWRNLGHPTGVVNLVYGPNLPTPRSTRVIKRTQVSKFVNKPP